MMTKARNKQENKNPHPIFNHTIYDLTVSAIQFVVPWQMEEGKEKKDARQLDINFGISNQ